MIQKNRQAQEESAMKKIKESKLKKKKEPKKKEGLIGGILAGFLVFLLLAGAAGTLVWFNLFDLKTEVATLLQLDAAWVEQTTQREAELNGMEASLMQDAEELDRGMAALATREDAVLSQEQKMTALEEELEAREQALQTQEADRESLIAVYEGMEPDKAAAILAAGTDPDFTTQVLSGMSPSRLSLVLAQMDPADAAGLIALLADAS